MNEVTQKRLGVINRQNIAKYGTGAVLSAGLMGATPAFALDVSTALKDNTASTNIDTAAVWVLGVVVTIFAARKVIGFFGR
ncbi:hypothetical protein [Acinetobacter guillouiae]